MPDAPAASDIAAVRAFNRFHTRLVGALNEGLLQTPLTLPQMRVIQEIARPAGPARSAQDLAVDLGMDRGYLSRLVTGLETKGLVIRTPDPENARRLTLQLTASGKDMFAGVDAVAAAEIAALLTPLTGPGRKSLVAAMDQIRALLGDAPAPIALRPLQPGDIGWITHRQMRLYHEEYGWDSSFESLIARIMADHIDTHDPATETARVACQGDAIIGSVFVVRADAETARLRLLYVEPAARGTGLGRRLVDEAVGFARAAGYRRMELWTNDILTAARHIYTTSGFSLDHEDRHHSFGKDLVGQVWSRDL